MRGHRMFSRFTIGAVVVPLVALTGAPARAADRSAEISEAKDGGALEAILSADAQTKNLITTRAADLGLALLSIRAGEAGKETIELRVAGGAKPFRDCEAACPSMVVVPSSPKGFKIGSPESEPHHTDDETQLEVSVPAFAIGATEVTVAEYKACVAAGGCKLPEWLEPGGQHNIETGSSRYYRNLGDNLTAPGQPVVGVSHEDATAYAAWLTSKTGHTYRLPSEAQWEFAARAGTKMAYWWGEALPADGIAHAACVGCGSEWDAKAPAPANAFAPNPWGLFNVHGNVWEWTADFYCDDYLSGPKDGSPRLTDDCPAVGDQPRARGVRSMRGGSVFYPAKIMRSAMRARNVPEFRNFSVGFRVARDLSP